MNPKQIDENLWGIFISDLEDLMSNKTAQFKEAFRRLELRKQAGRDDAAQFMGLFNDMADRGGLRSEEEFAKSTADTFDPLLKGNGETDSDFGDLDNVERIFLNKNNFKYSKANSSET